MGGKFSAAPRKLELLLKAREADPHNWGVRKALKPLLLSLLWDCFGVSENKAHKWPVNNWELMTFINDHNPWGIWGTFLVNLSLSN